MITLDLTQGTPEWEAHRFTARNASEAPVIMGASPNMTRNELLRMKATGDTQEFSDWVKNVLFAKGHEIEEQARPIEEKRLGEDLYPVVATDFGGYLSASLDGLTMDETVAWECKQLNQEKIQAVLNGTIPAEDYWQVVQQISVSGCTELIYAVTDGTEDNYVSMVVTAKSVEKDIKKLIRHWQRFDQDLIEYQHVNEPIPTVGKAPESLPALRVEVTGMVTSSNLQEFKEVALSVFNNIKTDLKTDDDFANAEKTTKWCKDVEDRLEQTKNHTLSQTASIDELFNAIDAIKEHARQTRLTLEKAVKIRKEAIRLEIKQDAESRISKHISDLNASFGGKASLPSQLNYNIPLAMKNKRTVSSLQNAVDTEVAKAKINIDDIASSIQTNLLELDSVDEKYRHLFVDTAQIALKETEDLKNIILLRISEFDKAEEKRLEAEREKIRAEEQAKIKEQARVDEQAKIKEQAKLDEQAKFEIQQEQERLEGSNHIDDSYNSYMNGSPQYDTPSIDNPSEHANKPGLVKESSSKKAFLPAKTTAMTRAAPLTEYQRGYIDGLKACAYKVNGELVIGADSTPLKNAIAFFIKTNAA